MMYAVDIETECTVEGCPWHGQAMCRNQHSLSPWHSRITVIGIVGPTECERIERSFRNDRGELVLRGPSMIHDFNVWLEHLWPDTEITMHNGKFDVLHLIQKGADQEILFNFWQHDSQLLAFTWTTKVPDEYLAWYTANKPAQQRAAGPHSLKTLAPYFLGVQPFWEVDDKDSDEYVLTDTRHTLALTEYLRANMPAEQQEFVDEKLLPWTKMLVEAELRGLKLDVAGLLKHREMLADLEHRLFKKLNKTWRDAHEAYANIMRMEVNRKYDMQKQTKSTEERRQVALAKAPAQINYGSHIQMKWLLGEFLGYDIKSLSGKLSTGKEVLIRLESEGKEDVAIFRDWRKKKKILTAFIPKMLSLKDNEDVIHPIYNPMGARTGRTSSERPNAQQVPSALKRFFKPRKGKLVGYDQAAIEAKLIAVYTEDPELLEIIRAGDSIHNANTIAFFGLDCKPSEVPTLHARERKAAKNVGFALFYHAGANRIRIALTQGGFPVTMAEAKRMHAAFKEKFATSLAYAGEVVETLEAAAVIPNLLGRPIRIQNPEDAYMKGFNTLIQSSASDINLDRMHAALTSLRAEGIEAYPVLTVHDYAGIEVVGDTEVVTRADEIIKHELTNFLLLTNDQPIKLTIEGGISDEWC